MCIVDYQTPEMRAAALRDWLTYIADRIASDIALLEGTPASRALSIARTDLETGLPWLREVAKERKAKRALTQPVEPERTDDPLRPTLDPHWEHLFSDAILFGVTSLPTHPYPPLAGPPDQDMVARLYRSDAWLTASGEWIKVQDLTTEHAWAILGFLRWYGKELLDADPAVRMDHMDYSSPSSYIESRPIWRAIDKELYARQELNFWPSAMVRLSQSGTVPWEEGAA